MEKDFLKEFIYKVAKENEKKSSNPIKKMKFEMFGQVKLNNWEITR